MVSTSRPTPAKTSWIRWWLAVLVTSVSVDVPEPQGIDAGSIPRFDANARLPRRVFRWKQARQSLPIVPPNALPMMDVFPKLHLLVVDPVMRRRLKREPACQQSTQEDLSLLAMSLKLMMAMV